MASQYSSSYGQPSLYGQSFSQNGQPIQSSSSYSFPLSSSLPSINRFDFAHSYHQISNPFPTLSSSIPTSNLLSDPPSPIKIRGACQPCRKKHQGCDHSRPCLKCRACGRPELCLDGPTPYQTRHRKAQQQRKNSKSTAHNLAPLEPLTVFPDLLSPSTTSNHSSMTTFMPTSYNTHNRTSSFGSGLDMNHTTWDNSLLPPLRPLNLPSSYSSSSSISSRSHSRNTSNLSASSSSSSLYDTPALSLRDRPAGGSSNTFSSGLPSLLPPLPPFASSPSFQSSFARTKPLPSLSSMNLSSHSELDVPSTRSSSGSINARSGGSVTLVMGTDMRIARASQDALGVLGYHPHEMVSQTMPHYLHSQDRYKWSTFFQRLMQYPVRPGQPAPAAPADMQGIRLSELTKTVTGMGSFCSTFEIRKHSGQYTMFDVKIYLGSYFGVRVDDPASFSRCLVIAKLTTRNSPAASSTSSVTSLGTAGRTARKVRRPSMSGLGDDLGTSRSGFSTLPSLAPLSSSSLFNTGGSGSHSREMSSLMSPSGSLHSSRSSLGSSTGFMGGPSLLEPFSQFSSTLPPVGSTRPSSALSNSSTNYLRSSPRLGRRSSTTNMSYRHYSPGPVLDDMDDDFGTQHTRLPSLSTWNIAKPPCLSSSDADDFSMPLTSPQRYPSPLFPIGPTKKRRTTNPAGAMSDMAYL